MKHVPEGLFIVGRKCVCYHLASEIIVFHNYTAALIGLCLCLPSRQIHTLRQMNMHAQADACPHIVTHAHTYARMQSHSTVQNYCTSI